jgi:putative chitinase
MRSAVRNISSPGTTKTAIGPAKLGNTEKGDGVRFHGRGYVQLSGHGDYGKAKTLVGADVVGTRDFGLGYGHRRQNSLAAMEMGLFTSKKFADYFNKTAEDWLNARMIINGLDCAPQIADYGKRFYGAISCTTGA